MTLTQHEQLEIWPLGYQMTSLHINRDSPESIYGQEGWWVGNPCERASGVKYQSCYLWGETGRSSGNSMMSEACRVLVHIPDWFRHIKDGDCGQRWWKVMLTCALATTLSTRPPPRTLQAPGKPAVSRCHGDASQSSAATTVNVNIRKVPKWRVCFRVWLCACMHINHVAARECTLSAWARIGECVDVVCYLSKRKSDVKPLVRLLLLNSLK